MPVSSKWFKAALTATVVVAASIPAASAGVVNIMPSAVISSSIAGTTGILRAGSPWGAGSTPSSLSASFDGAFMPENTQWNNGSLWWDQDPSVNTGPVSVTYDFDHAYNLQRFVVQADDNDSYLLEYWNGSSWNNAFAVPAVYTYGLVTRDSGLLGPFTASKLRFTATGGDNYYAVSEIQAFAEVTSAVPEPVTWITLVLGMFAVGAATRVRRTRLAAA
ncbi:MAG: hypothetical protein JSR96_04870 [Proteobacteria bacterium]|nr:hypothetical protein [Pseudomonadota bacterium]